LPSNNILLVMVLSLGVFAPAADALGSKTQNEIGMNTHIPSAVSLDLLVEMGPGALAPSILSRARGSGSRAGATGEAGAARAEKGRFYFLYAGISNTQ
jgi:hypothetical protein